MEEEEGEEDETGPFRSAEKSIKEGRNYLFNRYCESWGKPKELPTMEKLLHFVRDPILQFKNREDASVWLFAAIKVPASSSNVLTGTIGMLIMRDFATRIREDTGGRTIPDHMGYKLFYMLAGKKWERDIAEINENRMRMEANSAICLKQVQDQIAIEQKEDQVKAAALRNFSEIRTEFNKSAPKPQQPLALSEIRVEFDKSAPQPSIPAPPPPPPLPTVPRVREDEEDGEDDGLARLISDFQAEHGADDVDLVAENTNCSMSGEVFNKILEKTEREKREAKLHAEKQAYVEKEKNLRVLDQSARIRLELKLDRYDRFARTLKTEKVKLQRLYGCFVTDIIPKILAETTSSEPIEISTCADSALIKQIFERIKPTRDPALTELYELMAAKSFTFQAFYVYLYYITSIYADLYDATIKSPLKDNVDRLSLPTSQFFSIGDELAEMSIILKYFWGKAVFGQISGFNDTGNISVRRMHPSDMRQLIAMEMRTIYAPDWEKMRMEKEAQQRLGLRYKLRYIFKTKMIECAPFDVLVQFCRSREQFFLAFQTFVLKTLPDKEIIAAALMYYSRGNPIKHIILNQLEGNDFYEHEMWDVFGAFDPALGHRLECIQNKTAQLLKFGEGASKKADLFMEMLAGFDAEIRKFIAGEKAYISTMASLYILFLAETYFAKHENIRFVNSERFEITWLSMYFLPNPHPDLLHKRFAYDNEPFIAKWTGGMFMLRLRNDEMVISDILTILYAYKTEIDRLGGILLNDERYPIPDFLHFLQISRHDLSQGPPPGDRPHG